LNCGPTDFQSETAQKDGGSKTPVVLVLVVSINKMREIPMFGYVCLGVVRFVSDGYKVVTILGD